MVEGRFNCTQFSRRAVALQSRSGWLWCCLAGVSVALLVDYTPYILLRTPRALCSRVFTLRRRRRRRQHRRLYVWHMCAQMSRTRRHTHIHTRTPHRLAMFAPRSGCTNGLNACAHVFLATVNGAGLVTLFGVFPEKCVCLCVRTRVIWSHLDAAAFSEHDSRGSQTNARYNIDDNVCVYVG